MRKLQIAADTAKEAVRLAVEEGSLYLRQWGM